MIKVKVWLCKPGFKTVVRYISSRSRSNNVVRFLRCSSFAVTIIIYHGAKGKALGPENSAFSAVHRSGAYVGFVSKGSITTVICEQEQTETMFSIT